jgi:hypothetical protein
MENYAPLKNLCGSGNPVLHLFNIQTSWMPAFAGMTNYDTVFSGGGREEAI